MAQTFEPYDVAVEGPGFIAVQTPSGVAWTRAGHFAARGGRLVTRDEGYPVLSASGNIPLQGADIEVDADGTVRSGGSLAGRLRVEMFEPVALRPIGASLFIARAPGKAATAETRILQGRIEESSVKPLEEMTSLIESQRAFEMYQRALGITLNEVNRRAVNELGSVT